MNVYIVIEGEADTFYGIYLNKADAYGMAKVLGGDVIKYRISETEVKGPRFFPR